MSHFATKFLLEHPILLVLFVICAVALVIVFPATKRKTRASRPFETIVPTEAKIRRKTDARAKAPQPALQSNPETLPGYVSGHDDAPWVSGPYTQAPVQGYDPIPPGGATRSPEVNKRIRAGSARNMFGWPLGKEWFFEETHSILTPHKPLAHLSITNGSYLLVSPDLRAVLEQVDIGKGNFYETKFFEKDGTRPLPYRHTYWNIGNTKDTLLPDRTPGLRPITKDETSSLFGKYSKPKILKDGMLCLTDDCLQGVDVWAEEKISGAMFFSNVLVKKLQELGLDEDFHFTRCRMVDAE